MTLNDQATAAEIRAAFLDYEEALMANDVEALDRLFRDDPSTTRFGPGETLFGHAAIAAFRRARPGGSKQRDLLKIAIATFGPDVATANAVFRYRGERTTGRQSQTWVRLPEGWRIASAHVSLEQTPPDIAAEEAIIARFGHIFEHSPWVAARAAALKPGANATALKSAFADVLDAATPHERLDLIRAHPRLADRTAIAAGLTADSTSEQASAGLDRLTADEYAEFHRLNHAYDARFGFPFIICVRLHDKSGILAAMRARLARTGAEESAEAITQILLIAGLRLDAALKDTP